MVKTMAKLSMAQASTHGASKHAWCMQAAWANFMDKLAEKTEREKERLNYGNNNGQATHGASKHAWRKQARMAHASRLAKKLEEKMFNCPINNVNCLNYALGIKYTRILRYAIWAGICLF